MSGTEHDHPATHVGDRLDGGPRFLRVWKQTEFVDDDRVDTLTASWVRGGRKAFQVRLVAHGHPGLVDLDDWPSVLHPVGEEATAVLGLVEQLHGVALG